MCGLARSNGPFPRVADDQGWHLPRNRHSRPTRSCATGMACCQGGPSLWRQPWPLQNLQKADASGEAEAAVLLGRMYRPFAAITKPPTTEKGIKAAIGAHGRSSTTTIIGPGLEVGLRTHRAGRHVAAVKGKGKGMSFEPEDRYGSNIMAEAAVAHSVGGRPTRFIYAYIRTRSRKRLHRGSTSAMAPIEGSLSEGYRIWFTIQKHPTQT